MITQNLIQRAQKGDKKAIGRILNQSREYISHIANRYKRKANNADLMSAGKLGVARAISNFDTTKGSSFRSFCFSFIREAMIDVIKGKDLIKEPSDSHFPVEFVSLDATYEDEEGHAITLHDVIADPKSYPPDVIVEQREILSEVVELSQRERDIIALSYGLGIQEDRSSDEVAETIGISKNSVKKIRKRALKKLKNMFNDSHSLPSDDITT